MRSSFRHRKVCKYVRDTRREMGLPEGGCNFRGWPKHFHTPTEQRVMRAPSHLGYLIELWWDIRLKLNQPTCVGDERERFTALCIEVKRKIDAEIRKAIERKRNLSLQLRSDGHFVCVAQRT